MNRKLLIAAVGLAAVAGSTPVAADYGNFNISGRVRVGISQSKLSGSNGPYHERTGVDDNLSGFSMFGSEDITDGLKAFFSVETRFSPDVGSGSAISGLAYGNTGVGLQGAFGKVTLGRWDLHYTEFFAIEGLRTGAVSSHLGVGPMSQVANPNGTSLASYVANGRRTDNLILWDSPNWSGVTARLGYSTAFNVSEGANTAGTYTSTDPGKDGAYNMAVRYAGMGVTAGASIWNAKVEGETAATNNQAGDQQSVRLWAGYTFPFGLKVGVGVDESKWRFADGAEFTKRRATEVPVSYTTGAHTPYLSVGKMDELEGGPAGQNNADTGATMTTVGYDYALSKRTTLGASYWKIKNDPRAGYNGYGPHISSSAAGAGLMGTGARAGDDLTGLFIGIQHNF